MRNESKTLREFVGFVWPANDFSSQVGFLVLAEDVTDAGRFAHETYGEDFGMSLWSEEDAARPR